MHLVFHIVRDRIVIRLISNGSAVTTIKESINVFPRPHAFLQFCMQPIVNQGSTLAEIHGHNCFVVIGNTHTMSRIRKDHNLCLVGHDLLYFAFDCSQCGMGGSTIITYHNDVFGVTRAQSWNDNCTHGVHIIMTTIQWELSIVRVIDTNQ